MAGMVCVIHDDVFSDCAIFLEISVSWFNFVIIVVVTQKGRRKQQAVEEEPEEINEPESPDAFFCKLLPCIYVYSIRATHVPLHQG